MLPSRQSPRANFHDYSGGDYFVTICTLDKKHYFGKIIGDSMHFSALGKFCDGSLATLESHYSYVELPLYVVMPNHIHAIICIRERADAPGCVPTLRTALSVVVGGFKQRISMFARRNNIDFAWQGRYHDHIIRNYNDGNKIADYIKTNVARWSTDCFNDAPNDVGTHPGASAPTTNTLSPHDAGTRHGVSSRPQNTKPDL